MERISGKTAFDNSIGYDLISNDCLYLPKSFVLVVTSDTTKPTVTMLPWKKALMFYWLCTSLVLKPLCASKTVTPLNFWNYNDWMIIWSDFVSNIEIFAKVLTQGFSLVANVIGYTQYCGLEMQEPKNLCKDQLKNKNLHETNLLYTPCCSWLCKGLCRES